MKPSPKAPRSLTGGRRNPDLPGYYYEPTVLVDVDHSMSIMAEETFGPVIPIMQVNSPEEAVRLANDSRYGLSASIFSRDRSAAVKLADQLAQRRGLRQRQSGQLYHHPKRPWAAAKTAASATAMAPKGSASSASKKPSSSTVSASRKNFPWYPASEKKARQVRHLLNLLCHSGWAHKLRAIKGLIQS